VKDLILSDSSVNKEEIVKTMKELAGVIAEGANDFLNA